MYICSLKCYWMLTRECKENTLMIEHIPPHWKQSKQVYFALASKIWCLHTLHESYSGWRQTHTLDRSSAHHRTHTQTRTLFLLYHCCPTLAILQTLRKAWDFPESLAEWKARSFSFLPLNGVFVTCLWWLISGSLNPAGPVCQSVLRLKLLTFTNCITSQ